MSTFHLASKDSSDIWRVKLYLLGKDGTWLDQGTGDAQCSSSEGNVIINVINEEKTRVLLRVPIRVDENYERQQDSIIMWREPNVEGDIDCALSFQEVSACEELWQIILGTQDSHNRGQEDLLSSHSTQSNAENPNSESTPWKGIPGGKAKEARGWTGVSISAYSSSSPIPNVNIAYLSDIRSALAGCIHNPVRMEMCEYLSRHNGAYVRELLLLLEPLELVADQHSLCLLADILRSISLLSSEALLEVLLEDSVFPVFAGVMEHDRALNGKVSFRAFLRSNTAVMQSVPGARIKDNRQLAAVSRLFRLRYLRDSLVRPGLEEIGASTIDYQINVTVNDLCGRIFTDSKLLDKVFLALSSLPTADLNASPVTSPAAISTALGTAATSPGPAAAGDVQADANTEDSKPTPIRTHTHLQEHDIISHRQSKALQFLRELFTLSRQLPLDRRTELYEYFSRDHGRSLLDLCTTALSQPEETSGHSCVGIAEMLCSYSVACPDRVRQYVLQGPIPAQPHYAGQQGYCDGAVESSSTTAADSITSSTSLNFGIELNVVGIPTTRSPHSRVWTNDQGRNHQCLLWTLIRRLVLDTDVVVIDLLSDVLRVIIDSDRAASALGKDAFVSHFCGHYIQWMLVPFDWNESIVDGSDNVTSADGTTKHWSSAKSVSYQNAVSAVGNAPNTDIVSSGRLQGERQTAAVQCFTMLQQQRGRPALLATYRALIDILCACMSGHAHKMTYYMLRNETVSNVLMLLHFPHRHIQLSAVKFIRTILTTKDDHFFHLIVKSDMLAPVLRLLRDSPRKDSLLTSSVLEIVDYIRKEQLFVLAEYVVSRHVDCFSHKLHVHVLQSLQKLLQERKQKPDEAVDSDTSVGSGMWRASSVRKLAATRHGHLYGSMSAELRMLDALEDEQTYSTVSLELQSGEEPSRLAVAINEERMSEVGGEDRDIDEEEIQNESIKSPGLASAACASPSESVGTRPLTLLTLLAYGSDPNKLGALSPNIDMDVADTGSVNPRSQGSNSPRNIGHSPGNSSVGNGVSMESRGEHLDNVGKLSPTLKVPTSISLTSSPGTTSALSLSRNESIRRLSSAASLSGVRDKDDLQNASLPPITVPQKFACDEGDSGAFFRSSRKAISDESCGDKSITQSTASANSASSEPVGISFVMKKAKLQHG